MPPTSSIIGHLELKDPKFHSRKALEWAKEYGPVFRLRIFFRNVVVVSDIEYIKKFCLDNQTLYRPDVLNLGRSYYQGITTMNGKEWKDNKRVCMSALRDLGFAKPTVETKMMDQCRKVGEAVEKAEGKPLHLGWQFIEWSANNIAYFFMGPWKEGNSDMSDKMMDILQRSFVLLKSAGIYEYTPGILRTFLQLIPSTTDYKIDKIFKELDNFIMTETDLVVDGFFVPKGSVVLFNLWAVNRDPSLWKDPHHYNPSRFLLEDGSLMPHKPTCYVPFSFGKRSCPGDVFAFMETFLMVTFLLQKYDVHLDQPLPCDLDDPTTCYEKLQTTKLRFLRRSDGANRCSNVDN
ncbi:hypothetical protein HPB50_018724 [Hyalomma asiaticum]|uniref:Uncharacterized protein n=1 Tax=Hyalomma asiaticum TaxID=266040 RepID=A0ACB7RYC5_HYAAI|nr:hypothetical protein HPB50_018724 [Hyalomma asiaticum]